MRKNEFSRLDISIRGFALNQRGKEVRRIFPIENLLEIFTAIEGEIGEFNENLVELAQEVSGKYQRVGVHKMEIQVHSGKTYIHFQLGFVHREQEPLETYDIENEEVERITLDGEIYRLTRSYFTIVPDDTTIILDNKCHSGPTRFLIACLIEPHIESAQYGIALGEIADRLRITIAPVPKDDFEQILNQQFRQLRTLELTFSHPSHERMKLLPEDYDPTQDREVLNEVTDSLFNTLFGIDAETEGADQVPFKKIRISVSIDEKRGTAAKRFSLRNNARAFLRSVLSGLDRHKTRDNLSQQRVRIPT